MKPILVNALVLSPLSKEPISIGRDYSDIHSQRATHADNWTTPVIGNIFFAKVCVIQAATGCKPGVVISWFKPQAQRHIFVNWFSAYDYPRQVIFVSVPLL